MVSVSLARRPSAWRRLGGDCFFFERRRRARRRQPWTPAGRLAAELFVADALWSAGRSRAGRLSLGEARDVASGRGLGRLGRAARPWLAWGLGHNERFLSSPGGRLSPVLVIIGQYLSASQQHFSDRKMFCTICAERGGPSVRRIGLAGLLPVALFASGSDVYAQAQDSILNRRSRCLDSRPMSGRRSILSTRRGRARPPTIFLCSSRRPSQRAGFEGAGAQGSQRRPRRVQKRHDALRQEFRPPRRRWPNKKRRKKSQTEGSQRPAIADVTFAGFGLPMLQRRRRIRRRIRDQDPRPVAA